MKFEYLSTISGILCLAVTIMAFFVALLNLISVNIINIHSKPDPIFYGTALAVIAILLCFGHLEWHEKQDMKKGDDNKND
jgi:hypothetical protein